MRLCTMSQCMSMSGMFVIPLDEGEVNDTGWLSRFADVVAAVGAVWLGASFRIRRLLAGVDEWSL